ncbi:hypothetical protein NC661_03230 [Aquibacillus koreensis]|uniref:Uncharacterized protein n=1 Tax=Aquibacillus koreensis TaxID=279446 RepID=A0A9X3WIT8_9BACI|nr:hypothetical protein [Aquibacillus koreensis]MCT2536539.1 hypothetical protein [Aquibacillus koreensis]MDC3419373.1 hypothetical protein [Aquibacillus koreensis]
MSTGKKKKFDLKIFILIALPLSILILILVLPGFNVGGDLEKNIVEPHLDTVIEGDYVVEHISENMKARAGVSEEATIYEVIVVQDDTETTYELIVEDEKVVHSEILPFNR